MHLKPSHWTCTGKPKTGNAPYLLFLNSSALSCMPHPTLESGKALTLLQNIFPEECVDIEGNGSFNQVNINQRLSCWQIMFGNCCSRDCSPHNTDASLKSSRLPYYLACSAAASWSR